MKFKDIQLEDFEFDIADYSCSFNVPATNELIELSNAIRKRSGYTDFPTVDNDIYYSYYLVCSTELNDIQLRFSTNHSIDDYTDYQIDVFLDEEKMLLYKIVEYLLKENKNAGI